MAGFYWYERNPQLFNDEKQAMNLYFPNFVLDRLADGRICWVGNLNPRGADGGTAGISRGGASGRSCCPSARPGATT